MKIRCSLLLATLTAAAPAASVSWTTSPGVLDTEVSTAGTGITAYYFSPNAGLPASVPVNGVNFALHTSAADPAGLAFNGSFNNPEDVDLYQVPASPGNTGLNQILDGQNWGAAQALTVTGLAVGQQYQLQFMVSDDRPAFFNARNYDVSDANDAFGSRDVQFAYHSTRGGGVPVGAPPGSVEAKIFTGTFTADATTQDIWSWLYGNATHTGGDAGSQVNAFQLRLIPEPTAAVLGALGAVVLGLRRRR